LSSGYNVFKSKTSGKLAILAELIMIDSYSVTHGLIPRNDGSNIYDIVIYSEISPELNNENYNINPKLKYYHLKNSQCYLQKNDGSEITLFNDTKINNDFFNTKLSDIYSTSTSNNTLKTHGKFNFPKKDTYHSRMNLYTGSLENTPEKLFTKFSESKYHRIKKSQIINNSDYYINEINAKFYYYNPTDI
jgi:hypothetical protein